jgi:uncharacterized metal-binding protein
MQNPPIFLMDNVEKDFMEADKGVFFGHLYDEEDKRVMKVAEDTLNPKVDRIDEIIEFAREAGITRIGLANCITFEKEAKYLEVLLREEGFIVTRANCKLGRMPNEEILPGYSGISCNPAGQAKTMEESGTEMNLVMGLCLGHDMVFNAHSRVLTTTLIVKDRKLKHHTLLRFSET